jgi:threonine synthase
MGRYELICSRSGHQIPQEVYHRFCPVCAGDLAFHYDLENVRFDRDLPGIWRFIDLLPIAQPDQIVSLQEGNTPLLPANLSDALGIRLLWKWEGVNPTGAQKDRGRAVAIAKGRSFGFETAIIASTGSAGLSSAAYAARAGMKHAVLMSRGTPMARVMPVLALGSAVFEVDGTIEETLELLAAACNTLGAYETTTYRRANPYQSEGAKTLGYEIFLQLDDVPDWIVVPAGGAGTLGSIWRAFRELRALGLIERMPRLAGVQPADYNALEIAEQKGLSSDAELRALTWADDTPATVLVKLQHTYPYDGEEALMAIRESKGRVCVATDDEAFAAQRRIGASDGLYAEPSSTVTLTAIEKLIAAGAIEPGQTVVGILTGSGHRETHVLVERGDAAVEVITVENGQDRLARFLAASQPDDEAVA